MLSCCRSSWVTLVDRLSSPSSPSALSAFQSDRSNFQRGGRGDRGVVAVEKRRACWESAGLPRAAVSFDHVFHGCRRIARITRANPDPSNPSQSVLSVAKQNPRARHPLRRCTATRTPSRATAHNRAWLGAERSPRPPFAPRISRRLRTQPSRLCHLPDSAGASLLLRIRSAYASLHPG